MMLATPVRSSEWSSTTSTRACAWRAAPVTSRASASALAARGIVNDAGSQASTTSVPARAAVTNVSDAPMCSARSRMLVMPKPPTAPVAGMPRPSSATERRKPDAADGAGLHDDAAGAGVAGGVGQRLLRDADDLAFDAGSNGGSSSITSSTGTSLVRLHQIDHAMQRRGHVFPLAGLRPQRRDRAARLDQMRAREIDSRLEAARHRRQAAPPARCAACSCMRIAPKPCASVSWMSRAMRLRSSSTACRRASSRLLIDQPAVVERERRLLRRGVEQRRRQRRSHSESSTLDSAIQPSVFGGRCSGATSSDFTPAARLNSRTGSGSRASSPLVLDDRPVRPSAQAIRCRLMLSRGRSSDAQSGAVGHQRFAADVRHPQVAGAASLVEQPHAAGVRSRSRRPAA